MRSRYYSRWRKQGSHQMHELALEQASVPVQQVDYVNAHGTSTPYNDRSETCP